MKKKIALAGIILCIVLFFIPSKEKVLEVFRITEQPDVIAKGTYGNTITLDVSFGDEELKNWLNALAVPYPLLMVDADWLKRSPSIIKLINQKRIPTGLLGKESVDYEENPKLIQEELAIYELYLGQKPLWFRTKDQVFPNSLRKILWQEQINMLGSSKVWLSAGPPSLSKGDILAVPLNQDQPISLKAIDALLSRQTFQPIEETIFGYSVQTKKFP